MENKKIISQDLQNLIYINLNNSWSAVLNLSEVFCLITAEKLSYSDINQCLAEPQIFGYLMIKNHYCQIMQLSFNQAKKQYRTFFTSWSILQSSQNLLQARNYYASPSFVYSFENFSKQIKMKIIINCLEISRSLCEIVPMQELCALFQTRHLVASLATVKSLASDP